MRVIDKLLDRLSTPVSNHSIAV